MNLYGIHSEEEEESALYDCALGVSPVTSYSGAKRICMASTADR